MARGGCCCCGTGAAAVGWYGNDDGWFDDDGLNENCGGLWHKTNNDLIKIINKLNNKKKNFTTYQLEQWQIINWSIWS